MAVAGLGVKMDKYSPDNDYSFPEAKKGYYYKETLTSAENGDWILVPIGTKLCSVILGISSGSGKIEVTNDVDALRSGADPNAIDIVPWDNGTITATASSIIQPVYAIRQVNISGTTSLTVVAQ